MLLQWQNAGSNPLCKWFWVSLDPKQWVQTQAGLHFHIRLEKGRFLLIGSLLYTSHTHSPQQTSDQIFKTSFELFGFCVGFCKSHESIMISHVILFAASFLSLKVRANSNSRWVLSLHDPHQKFFSRPGSFFVYAPAEIKVEQLLFCCIKQHNKSIR